MFSDYYLDFLNIIHKLSIKVPNLEKLFLTIPVFIAFANITHTEFTIDLVSIVIEIGIKRKVNITQRILESTKYDLENKPLDLFNICSC